ncbi:hypothetical protein [Streptococcus ruminantium]|uniref:hypothetical protein n=1 Tax=Streptococcus ruminantium TaxID=1917441 RepID=UPI0012DC2C7B|nr:hypothetical protein [Streptococcus ruminantium]
MLLNIGQITMFLTATKQTKKLEFTEIKISELITAQEYINKHNLKFKLKNSETVQNLVINLKMIKSFYNDELIQDEVYLNRLKFGQMIVDYRHKRIEFESLTNAVLIETFLFLQAHPQMATKNNKVYFGIFFEFLTDSKEFSLDLSDKLKIHRDECGLIDDYLLSFDEMYDRADEKWSEVTVDELMDFMFENIEAYSA